MLRLGLIFCQSVYKQRFLIVWRKTHTFVFSLDVWTGTVKERGQFVVLWCDQDSSEGVSETHFLK